MRLRPVLALALVLGPAAAAQEPLQPLTVYPEETEIDMEAVDVTAPLVQPSIELIGETRKVRFGPMIRFREDFDLEVRESVDEVK